MIVSTGSSSQREPLPYRQNVCLAGSDSGRNPVESLRVEAVVGPLPALIAANQSAINQQFHVMGHGGLAQSERFGEVADARFAAVGGRDEDTSLTRAGSASALNTAARRSAAAVSSTPPVSGEQHAATSAPVNGAVTVGMPSMMTYALTNIDGSSSIDRIEDCR